MAASSLIMGLDQQIAINKQYGENGNIEYSWGNDYKELITQLFSQLNETTKNDEESFKNIRAIYRNLISNCFLIYMKNNNSEYYLLLQTLYKLIGNTRDIVEGKGIYSLTYMLIAEWAYFGYVNPQYKKIGENLTIFAIKCLVNSSDNKHPLGSWKDIKYFCNYWKDNFRYYDKQDTVMNEIMKMVTNQLLEDSINIPLKRSLLAKWIPREKSKKFGWLNKELAYYYFYHYLENAKESDNSYKKAQRKCLTEFRHLIAGINESLKTTQIYQCNNNWKEINFDKTVTSITMRKQSYAFQNITKKNQSRTHNSVEKDLDRKTCAEHYKNYVERCVKDPNKAKSRNISIVDFVKSAIELNYDNNEVEKNIINSQWINNSLNTKELGNMIAMVDTSASMQCDNNFPLYSAIGLGLRVAEKSKLGKRVLTFSHKPEWINLDDCNNFVESVKKIQNAPWGMNTNFRAALKLILDTAIKNNIPPEEMKDMVLVIFSDMQIDQGIDKTSMHSMFELIEDDYHKAGLKTEYNTPYPIPHILFWNLRTTNGFPNLCKTKNTSMLSGGSSKLLNLFAEKGMNILAEITPWKMLQECVNNTRYKELENYLKSELIDSKLEIE